MFNKILKYVQAMEKNAILFLVHHRSNINQSIIHYIPHLVKGSWVHHESMRKKKWEDK